MALSLKESRAATEMAIVLYSFLPGSGSRQWEGHISFKTVAQEVGVGDFWQIGSKEPAIAALIERTLEYRRDKFEKLILTIVKEGLKHRQKNNDPIKEEEINTLNGLIREVGFKFPALWDKDFLTSLRSDGVTRASKIVEEELQAEKIQHIQQAEITQKRDELKTIFYELSSQANRQQAGFSLEKLLNGLFDLFKLSPRDSFRIEGEQIDGSFELDNENYLVEAKWEARPLPEAPLLVFRGKIEGKSTFTRGVFIALNFITPQALEAITRGKQPNFFILDGYDLTVVLEGTIRFDDLLRKKRRHLADEGKVFISARELI